MGKALLTFDLASSKTPPTIRASPYRNTERTSIEYSASEDPAIDSGLNAVSFEGSILLYNDYRHASPSARSESWGVVDVQVDFTGLAIISPDRS